MEVTTGWAKAVIINGTKPKIAADNWQPVGTLGWAQLRQQLFRFVWGTSFLSMKGWSDCSHCAWKLSQSMLESVVIVCSPKCKKCPQEHWCCGFCKWKRFWFLLPFELKAFVLEFSAPKKFAANGTSEMQMRRGWAMVSESCRNLEATLSHSLQQNNAEATFRKLKKLTRKKDPLNSDTKKTLVSCWKMKSCNPQTVFAGDTRAGLWNTSLLVRTVFAFFSQAPSVAWVPRANLWTPMPTTTLGHWLGLNKAQDKMVTCVEPNMRQLWPQCTTMMLCLPFQECKKNGNNKTCHNSIQNNWTSNAMHSWSTWELTANSSGRLTQCKDWRSGRLHFCQRHWCTISRLLSLIFSLLMTNFGWMQTQCNDGNNQGQNGWHQPTGLDGRDKN